MLSMINPFGRSCKRKRRSHPFMTCLIVISKPNINTFSKNNESGEVGKKGAEIISFDIISSFQDESLVEILREIIDVLSNENRGLAL